MQKRYIFKRALSGILPDAVLYKKKHGFGVPLAEWLLHEPGLNTLLNDVLSDSQTLQRGWLRRSFVDKLRQQHRGGHSAYYGENVWYVLVLELWQRHHLGKLRTVADVR
jgi:asparagine synthase (glutamine-hydrolysing)